MAGNAVKIVMMFKEMSSIDDFCRFVVVMVLGDVPTSRNNRRYSNKDV